MMMESSVLGLALADDMDTLVSGSQDGIVKVWRLTTGECIRRVVAHTQAVTQVAFHHGGFLSSSLDGTLR